MRATDRFAFTRHFRLRGTFDGAVRTFPLAAGENSIGREPQKQVVLAVKGVSLTHATLTIGPDGIRIEDLGSKNGTFVNGARITSVELSPGDELGIGSAVLVLEELEDAQRRLAVELAPPLAHQAYQPLDDEERTATGSLWLDVRLVERWLSSVEAVVAQLEQPAEGRLLAACQSLAGATGAAAVVMLELSATSEPVLLAACGELPEGLDVALKAAAPGERQLAAAQGGAHGFTALTPSGSLLTVSLGIEDDAPDLALVLCGEFPGRKEVEPLLAAHLSLALKFRGGTLLSASVARNQASRPLDFPPDYVAGSSLAMRQLHAQLLLMAQGSLPVLLSGETGVGKECVARILHASSDRRDGPFVAINCAAVPAELLEAELFGIGKGVATGVQLREGQIPKAQGGTLLLDEIGDLPEPLQPKLLRALEEGVIHPLGGPPLAVDVRIVSATNSDLPARIAAGTFRADLYYRLAGASLTIPPLRQRKGDLAALVAHFLRRISNEIGKPIRGITVDAMARLEAHDWPGNVRELIHEVRRLVAVCPAGEAIETAHLREALQGGASGDQGSSATADAAFTDWLREAEDLSFRAVECALLDEALRRSGGNQTQAAQLLGVSRMAVRRRMERCAGLEGEDSEADEDS